MIPVERHQTYLIGNTSGQGIALVALGTSAEAPSVAVMGVIALIGCFGMYWNLPRSGSE